MAFLLNSGISIETERLQCYSKRRLYFWRLFGRNQQILLIIPQHTTNESFNTTTIEYPPFILATWPKTTTLARCITASSSLLRAHPSSWRRGTEPCLENAQVRDGPVFVYLRTFVCVRVCVLPKGTSIHTTHINNSLIKTITNTNLAYRIKQKHYSTWLAFCSDHRKTQNV